MAAPNRSATAHERSGSPTRMGNIINVTGGTM
jgi:hypothetical protein